MNDKKYIFSGVALCIIGLVVGVFYYLPSGTLTNMFSDGPDAIVSASDVDISTTTDIISPSSTDEQAITQAIPAKKITKASVSEKKSSEKENDGNISNEASDAGGEPLNDAQDIIAPVEPSSSPPSAQSQSCAFPNTASSTQSRKIILNEIAWMGSASSSNAEWMEIKNNSANDVALSGWELLDVSGKITILFSSDDEISAGGLLLLSRGTSTNSNVVGSVAQKLYSGNLSNAGDVLAIMDPQCVTSDILDASSGWPAGNNTTKQTLERDPDGIGWHTSILPGGTPGVENSLVTPPIPKISTSSGSGNSFDPPPSAQVLATTSTPSTSTSDDPNSASTSTTSSSTTVSTSMVALGHILISAIQIAGASSTNDLVKLYNPTGALIDMSGWKLHKRSETGTEYSLKDFPSGSTVASGQSFVWANSTGGFSETVAANVSSTETLSADNSVALLDANGTVIDAVAWGTGTGQYGEGTPYATNPMAGQVLARQASNGAMVDTSNNANDFILQ